jgi:hypothetical protein
MSRDLLVLDGNRSATVAYTAADGGALIAATDLEPALDWTLKPEGLCRGDVCVPVRDRTLVAGANVDIASVATLLGQPIVVDAARGVAAIGAAAHTRVEQMATLDAPDFSLPRVSNGDDDGTMVSLHDFDRRKVLLLAWSSW